MLMRLLFITIQVFIFASLHAQQGFAFTHFSTADGIGLASNKVGSLYQDEKGFIWVGTANGLQRFDGSKFIQFSSGRSGRNEMPHAYISQIVPADSGRLILLMPNTGELGLFDPANFSYKKIRIKTGMPFSPRVELRLWKAANHTVFLIAHKYGMFQYDPFENAFINNQPFPFPNGWNVSLTGIFEDPKKKQVWFACDSGLCVYNRESLEMWSRNFNPKKLALLENKLIQQQVSQVFIDSKKRMWVFGWLEMNANYQYKLCFDSAGSMNPADTAGLNSGSGGFVSYDRLFETRDKDLWIYGKGVLYNYDKVTRRFYLNKTKEGSKNISISYNVVNEVMEDKDGSLWIATDKGLYYTSYGSGNMSVINLILNDEKEIAITDILETENGELWLATNGNGIKSLDTFFNKVPNYVYRQQPPADWSEFQKAGIYYTRSLCPDVNTGDTWIGCNNGIILIHNSKKKTTSYLQPVECNYSNINYIAQDWAGAIWLGTKSGRLVKYYNKQFTVVLEVGTNIFKVFVDRQDWIWVSTSGKGLMAVDPNNGKILQQYTAGNGIHNLYSNTGMDIEQLNDSIIVFGAGVLNFINKRTGHVRHLGYEDGLPSNNVERLRMDRNGFLWIITLNGLCRYNPHNSHITPYGPKDGVVVGEQTNMADYESKKGHVLFSGANAILMFQPSVFSSNKIPPDVTITDFKIFNQFIPVDSILQYPEVKLMNDQNSFSIYFASLSYIQRDKLTYYYRMEGIDKDWVKADRSYFVNYSLLPPGKYIFKVFCENIEGVASPNITELNVFIKPPFWRTLWFMSSVLFTIALLIYVVHDLRIKRLLAVEKLRQRVARDLHDDMGSTLSTINILSSMAKAKMNTDAIRTSEYLSKISDNSQRMMEAMDDIIWSIKPSNDSMQRIAARMREFATSVLEAKDIDLDFNIDEEINDIKLNMEARRDFFLVFKEAVNNAAKYSYAAKVWVNVVMENRKLSLTVKDDGKGFNINEESDGNGLGNMRKRTDHMNGKLMIQSKEGNGTTVTVTIPVFQ